MGAVMPVSASSLSLTRKAPPSFVWNNRTVVVIVCLASAFLFIYHLLKSRRNPSYLPDLSKRLTAEIFPDCAMQELPFKAPFAQGIIQIHPMTQNDLSIVCYFDDKLFFQQPITDSVYIPELPYNKEIIIALCHQRKVLLLTTLTISHLMGIYEIGAPVNKNNSLPQLLPRQSRLMSSKDSPLSIKIDVENGLKIETSSAYQFQNHSFFTHVLFFKIREYDPANPSQQHSMTVPVLVPCGTRSLPLDFFHRSWRESSLSHFQIEILALQDTLIPWCRDLLQ